MLSRTFQTHINVDSCSISINHSVLPKGKSFTAKSAFSTLSSSQPSFSYLHTVLLSWCLSSDIFFCRDPSRLPFLLEHGCARVAHCVTARWRNFSHYYCPLRLINVYWAQRSTGLCADSTRWTQTRVHSARRKYIVCHWTSREASLRHSCGWGTWSVSP